MHIAINGHFLDQPTTGSGQYTRNLWQALAKVGAANEYSILYHHSNADQRITTARPQKTAYRATTTPFDRLNSDLAKVWFEQISFPVFCRRERMDLAHVPYFAPPLRPLLPTVVTIHDLIPMVLPAYRGSPLVRLYTHLVAAAALRAELILTDSQASKRDILRLLGLPGERVRVIPLAAEERFHPVEDAEHLKGTKDKYGLPDDYLLYLGGFDCRKNLAALLRAFARVAQEPGGCHRLVIAGRLPERDTPFFPDPRRLARETGVEQEVIFIGWVAEEDKAALYSGARAFVFPSLYEGFGLPVLEALACGAPVITSNLSSLPEIVGPSGLTIDPQEPDQLAQAMIELLNDEEMQRELGRKGLERAGEFSWERTARQTLAAYEEVAT